MNSLRRLLGMVKAQVNPFDGGKTFASESEGWKRIDNENARRPGYRAPQSNIRPDIPLPQENVTTGQIENFLPNTSVLTAMPRPPLKREPGPSYFDPNNTGVRTFTSQAIPLTHSYKQLPQLNTIPKGYSVYGNQAGDTWYEDEATGRRVSQYGGY